MARKIRYKRLIIFICLILVVLLCLFKLFCLRISNIYVSDNLYLSDQEVIEYSRLSNYPRALFTFSKSIESTLNKSEYIKSSKVTRKGLTKVYISVVENRPLFYDQEKNKTVLADGKTVNKKDNVPVLVNSVDGSIYSEFLSQLSLINLDVFNSISEIEYSPNNVDSKLFLFSMNDGNYISVNLDKFTNINKYFDIVVNFNNRKGILYLDSGEYFKILEN